MQRRRQQTISKFVRTHRQQGEEDQWLIHLPAQAGPAHTRRDTLHTYVNQVVHGLHTELTRCLPPSTRTHCSDGVGVPTSPAREKHTVKRTVAHLCHGRVLVEGRHCRHPIFREGPSWPTLGAGQRFVRTTEQGGKLWLISCNADVRTLQYRVKSRAAVTVHAGGYSKQSSANDGTE